MLYIPMYIFCAFKNNRASRWCTLFMHWPPRTDQGAHISALQQTLLRARQEIQHVNNIQAINDKKLRKCSTDWNFLFAESTTKNILLSLLFKTIHLYIAGRKCRPNYGPRSNSRLDRTLRLHHHQKNFSFSTLHINFFVKVSTTLSLLCVNV
jgi:hypothetical protein